MVLYMYFQDGHWLFPRELWGNGGLLTFLNANWMRYALFKGFRNWFAKWCIQVVCGVGGLFWGGLGFGMDWKLQGSHRFMGCCWGWSHGGFGGIALNDAHLFKRCGLDCLGFLRMKEVMGQFSLS